MDRKAALVEYIKSEIMRNRNEDLLSSGVLDSLGRLQIVAFIEKTFGIRVPDEDVVFENFQSVNAMAAYLQQY